MVTDAHCVLRLNSDRTVAEGSEAALCDAIRRGADLLVGTEFGHNEHIDTASDNPELIQEVAEFRVTYLVEDRWAAGIMSLRQPISLPDAFGVSPSMSLFLYNQNGEQAIARPFLDGMARTGGRGASEPADHSDMPKYHERDRWDAGTNAPSSNFVYDFDVFRYLVRDDWRQVLAHEADGTVTGGSAEALAEASAAGCAVKSAVAGLCADLEPEGWEPVPHEVFVQAGSCYYYTQQGLFIAGSHPVVRVRPAIPLRYASGGWDFGWLMLKTDGQVITRLCDPHTLKFTDTRRRCAIRWFVR